MISLFRSYIPDIRLKIILIISFYCFFFIFACGNDNPPDFPDTPDTPAHSGYGTLKWGDTYEDVNSLYDISPYELKPSFGIQWPEGVEAFEEIDVSEYFDSNKQGLPLSPV